MLSAKTQKGNGVSRGGPAKGAEEGLPKAPWNRKDGKGAGLKDMGMRHAIIVVKGTHDMSQPLPSPSHLTSEKWERMKAGSEKREEAGRSRGKERRWEREEKERGGREEERRRKNKCTVR
jgi:hypothetical protein